MSPTFLTYYTRRLYVSTYIKFYEMQLVLEYYLLYFQCKVEQIRSSNNAISLTIGNRPSQMKFFVEIVANSGRLPDAFLHTA